MKDKDHKMETQRTSKMEVVDSGILTPHDEAIFEAGKALLIDSIKTGRDFCQFMITTSTGAIPVYLAIMAFLLPKDYTLGIGKGIVIAGPALLFLVAALIFAFGYFPTSNYFSLDDPDEVEKARNRIINRRRNLAIAGFISFAIATLYAIFVVIVNIGVR